MEPGSDVEGASLRWPSQDMVDRSGDFAIIAFFASPPQAPRDVEAIIAAKQESWCLAESFQEALDRAVAESVREILGSVLVQPTPARHYQIGPAAEQVTTLIVDLWNHAQDLEPILSGLADAYAITEITWRVFSKLKRWTHEVGAKFAEPSLILTPYQLTKLCEEHVRRAYHPRAKLSDEWFVTTTEFYAGYSSPAHPTGAVEYLVTISAGRKIYCYAANGAGLVKSHYVRKGKRSDPLPIPVLLGRSEDEVNQSSASRSNLSKACASSD